MKMLATEEKTSPQTGQDARVRAFADMSGNSRAPGDSHEQGRQIEALINQIESFPDPEARSLLYECVQSLLALYGNGLARILQLIKNAGAEGLRIRDALADDKFVRGLLLIHGLHPVDLEVRVREALATVRPYLQSHGGNVELISLQNDIVRLRLQGTCKSCPSSSVTLELAVRQAIEEACPDVMGFEVEGGVGSSAPEVSLGNDAPRWTLIDGMDRLEDGEMRALKLQGVPVLICRADSHLYAYRNVCPDCNDKLDSGALNDGILHCPEGHQFDVRHAGKSPGNAELHLDPFPLLEVNGVVKISVR